MNSKEYLIDLVDEKDHAIGKATEEEVREKNLLHHSIHLLVVDFQNRLFCAHRIMGRPIYSGWWTIPGAHICSGETYEKTLTRFLKELKLSGSFNQLQKIRVNDGFENEWSMLYLLKSNTAPFLSSEKFQKGKFLSVAEIQILLKKEKVTPYLVAAVEFVSKK